MLGLIDGVSKHENARQGRSGKIKGVKIDERLAASFIYPCPFTDNERLRLSFLDKRAKYI